jgi:hypothetical protein
MAINQILEPALGKNVVAQYGEGNSQLSFGFKPADFDRAAPLKQKVQDFVNAFEEKGRHADVVFEKVTF